MPIDNKGERNPMYGRKHSEETKRKIAESRKKYCMENHPQWKGGRRVTASGYIEIMMPDHHRARKNGYVFEHILIAEQKIGRELLPHEIVHHFDENKKNNHPDNLKVISTYDHHKYHADIYEAKKKGKNINCCICGSEFYIKRKEFGRRHTCSMKCAGEYFRRLYTGKPRDYKPTLEDKRRISNDK